MTIEVSTESNPALIQSTVNALADTDTLQQTKTAFKDGNTFKLIQGFLFAPKPKGLGLPEVALTLAYLAIKAMDHDVTYSHQKLAEMLGCDPSTIKRIEKSLKKQGILSQISRKGRTKQTLLNLDSLPMVDGSLPKMPTPEAEELKKWYIGYMQVHHYYLINKKKTKQWYKTLAWGAQNIINKCGGDAAMARTKIEYAFTHPDHRKYAVWSLYKLDGRWKHVEKSYAEKDLPKVTEQPKETPIIPAIADSMFTESEEDMF
jgi:Crp-like helix-turn-helix domain